MGNFVVRYASRVVIYNRRAVIRFAAGVVPIKILQHKFYTTLIFEAF